MTDQKNSDNNDAHGAAYETMYQHVAENLNKAKDKTGTLLHELIDEAKEKVKKIEEVTEEDAENLTIWLKRDLDDAINYLAETDYELKDWLGFETTLLKDAVLHALLETADKTTVALLRMKQNAHEPYVYHTGEIAGPGTLICDACGEKLHFHNAGHIPPCAKCHETDFHRIQVE